MPVICPKCSHVRPADAANPDWQCPACGVCYAKVGTQAAEPVRPRAVAGVNGGRSLGPAWLWLVLFLFAVSVGINRYIDRSPAPGAGETQVAGTRAPVKLEELGEAERARYEQNMAALDKALRESAVDAGMMRQLSGRLDRSCARNRFGLSESDCLARLREREGPCADEVKQRYPGQIGKTERLQEITVAYVRCVFEAA